MKQPLYVLLLSLIFVLSCSSNRNDNNTTVLAVVGKTIINQEDFDAFNTVIDLLPKQSDKLDILNGDRVSVIIQVEALFQKESRKVAKIGVLLGKDWQWKKRNIISQMFAAEILQRNCGYSDNEVKDYFIANKKIFFPSSTGDTAKSNEAAFDSVRWTVAKVLFLSNYKPDSTNWNLNNPSAFKLFRESFYADYFLKKYYKQKYNRDFPADSLKKLLKDNIVDSIDMSIVLSWLPEEQQKHFIAHTPLLVSRMIKWKLFTENADHMGYSSTPHIKRILAWAWKIEIARRYSHDRLEPVALKPIPFDSTMAILSYWDEHETEICKIDSIELKKYLTRIQFQHAKQLFDSLNFTIRQSAEIKFLHPESWADSKEQDPVQLLHMADSALKTGDTIQARSYYNVLTDYYCFVDEGRKSLLELAKIQADMQDTKNAIINYRKYLLRGTDADSKAAILLRIGFLYDQFLNKKDLAKANYQWIIKNNPKNKLAQDAENMLLHLSEPMPDIEEQKTP